MTSSSFMPGFTRSQLVGTSQAGELSAAREGVTLVLRPIEAVRVVRSSSSMRRDWASSSRCRRRTSFSSCRTRKSSTTADAGGPSMTKRQENEQSGQETGDTRAHDGKPADDGLRNSRAAHPAGRGQAAAARGYHGRHSFFRGSARVTRRFHVLGAAILFLSLTQSVMSNTPNTSSTPADPFLWLEDVEGDKALTWVRGQNDRSLKQLTGDPRLRSQLQSRARHSRRQEPHSLWATLRDGWVYNFWQDDVNVRGPLAPYATRDRTRRRRPQWQTLLDLDALAKKEDRNWVWKGVSVRAAAGRALHGEALERRQGREHPARVRSRQARVRRGRLRLARSEGGPRPGRTRTR